MKARKEQGEQVAAHARDGALRGQVLALGVIHASDRDVGVEQCLGDELDQMFHPGSVPRAAAARAPNILKA